LAILPSQGFNFGDSPWSLAIMKDSLYDRLWRRECGDLSPFASLRGIYGSKEWIDDLDIVNELGGHTGCVNALRYV
jgi:nuclear receptor interaction protein